VLAVGAGPLAPRHAAAQAFRPRAALAPLQRRVEPRARLERRRGRTGRAVGIERHLVRERERGGALGGGVGEGQAPPRAHAEVRAYPLQEHHVFVPGARGDATGPARGGGAGENVEHALFAAAGGAGRVSAVPRRGAKRGRARR
jgi:hypothetical protein